LNTDSSRSKRFDIRVSTSPDGRVNLTIIRIIGVELMKGKDEPVRHKTIKRRKIGTIIDNILLIAGHLTEHARKIKLALGRSNGWRKASIRLCVAV
jgi:hypothetical protein